MQASNPAILPRSKHPFPSFIFFLSTDAHSVNPAYLRGPSFDLHLLSNATKAARLVSQTAPLSSIVSEELVPGLASVPLNASDEVWQDWVLQNIQPVKHPLGTVAMLPKEMGGAVGSDLKLYGSSNVRVVGKFVTVMFVCFRYGMP